MSAFNGESSNLRANLLLIPAVVCRSERNGRRGCSDTEEPWPGRGRIEASGGAGQEEGGMMISRVLAIGFAVGMMGCVRPAEDCRPLPAHDPSGYLEREIERALGAVREARAKVQPPQEAAERGLARAEKSLVRLRGYYLPMLGARASADNARWAYTMGEGALCRSELDRTERALLGVAELNGSDLARELEQPLETLEDVRVAMAGAPEDVPALLEALADRLDTMLAKADLILK